MAVGVNTRSDVTTLRSFLDDNGGEGIRLVAKIQTEGERLRLRV